MGIMDEERQTKEALGTLLGELLKTDVNSLMRSEDLGTNSRESNQSC